MSLLEAAVLGIVQGLTEWLPISSTAHLRIVPALLGWSDPGPAFTAVIQIGTLLAVLLYFRNDIAGMTVAFFRAIGRGKPFETPEARLAWMIVVGTIPVVVCGVLFKSHIKTTLRSLWVISGMLIGVAVLMALAEWMVRRRLGPQHREKGIEDVGWREALLIGFAQAVALVPGASRSGVTITGGLFVGLSREAAARFSFLLSLPSVLAAGVYELYEERERLLSSQAGMLRLVLATVVAAVVGYASIAFLLYYLRRRSMGLFILYRLGLAALLIALLATGRLTP